MSQDEQGLYYYEHCILFYHSPYESSQEAYPHIDADYHLLGHEVVNIDGNGVLIFWSATELDKSTQQLIDHEMQPDQSIYNMQQQQGFAEFWHHYTRQDGKTKQRYWDEKKFKFDV